jgi:GAF domain-containing protein
MTGTADIRDATIESLREQLHAVGDVLRALARSEGLQPVLDEIAEAARRLCGGESAQLYLAEGDLLRVFSHSTGEPEEDYEHAERHPHARDRTTIVGRVALSGEVVQIVDPHADPDYYYALPTRIRVLLGVPILFEEDLIGAIAIAGEEPKPFSDDQIELVKTFADQAAIAIANARLLETVERQLEQQRAIGDVLQAVARSEGLGAVFDVVVDAATRLCRGDYGALYLSDGDVLRVMTQHYGHPELYEFERAHPHVIDRTSVIGRVALTRAVVHIPDTRADPEYAWGGAGITEYRSLLGAPILVDEELIGAMNVVRVDQEPFTDEQIDLLRTFADQAAIAIANARLIEAVERQKTELSRFVSPQVAELVSSDEGEKLLAGHRANISVVFCDLRGFTSFTETAEPEELIEVLGEYHRELGSLVPKYEGTFKDFAGDSMTVLFNDPLPVEHHELKAVRFALAARQCFSELAAGWRKRGIELGLGIGLSAGYATLGRIGFEGRYDYGALGGVMNLAARLTAQAKPGEILIGQRMFAAVEDHVDAHPVGELELKGFREPVVAYEVRGLRSAGAA